MGFSDSIGQEFGSSASRAKSALNSDCDAAASLTGSTSSGVLIWQPEEEKCLISSIIYSPAASARPGMHGSRRQLGRPAGRGRPDVIHCSSLC
jgi:hypothetical protein